MKMGQVWVGHGVPIFGPEQKYLGAMTIDQDLTQIQDSTQIQTQTKGFNLDPE